ncbi:MAG: 7-carboxy-7-deazaguanine synthase QueE [Planctomycetota bacterium]
MSQRRYAVSEIAGPTLQGEGPHAGSPAVIVRLAGCNAWDGQSDHRAASACPWCDTDFRPREQLDAPAIRARIETLLENTAAQHHGCILTGGEPLLQADAPLLAMLAATCAWVDVETNGTRPSPQAPANVQVICSPKTIPAAPVVVDPDCWKILIPGGAAFLERALDSGRPVWVQPEWADAPDGPRYREHLARCVELCHAHGCRLSLQLHKYLGLA